MMKPRCIGSVHDILGGVGHFGPAIFFLLRPAGRSAW